MPLVFLDASPIIRLITQDHPEHAARSRALFERAGRGELTLYLSEAVVVEVVNVLSSTRLYQLPRSEVERHLHRLFALREVTVPRKNLYRRALDLWVNTPAVRDFADALHVAHMERLKITTIASFDADFDRFSQVTRLQP